MSYLRELSKKLAGLFQGVDVSTEAVEGLARQIVIWELRRESLQGEKAGAYGQLLDLREQELDGRPDPKALAAARAEVTDLDERLDAVSRKILGLHEELAAAAAAEIAYRHETAAERLAAMEEERRAVLPRLADLLAEAELIKGRYFSGPKEFPFVLAELKLPGFDAALDQLKIENPDDGFMGRLKEARDDLTRSPGSHEEVNWRAGRGKALLKVLRSEVESGKA
jgi:hypothetical protein